jgi:hypothetical protein
MPEDILNVLQVLHWQAFQQGLHSGPVQGPVPILLEVLDATQAHIGIQFSF